MAEKKVKINIIGRVEDGKGVWPLGEREVDINEAQRLIKAGAAESLTKSNVETDEKGDSKTIYNREETIKLLVKLGYKDNKALHECVDILLDDGFVIENPLFENKLKALLESYYAAEEGEKLRRNETIKPEPHKKGKR